MTSASSPATIAAAHGALRHLAGFNLAQLVSEFRAMRASVLSPWRRPRSPRDCSGDRGDRRFNEAIDEALTDL